MPHVLNDDDVGLLAAEYVLGTLDLDERLRTHALLDVDHGFRGMVRIWERRLGELHLMVEPVEPDAQVWDRIKARIAGVEPSPQMRLPEAEPAVSVPRSESVEERESGGYKAEERVVEGEEEEARAEDRKEEVRAERRGWSTQPHRPSRGLRHWQALALVMGLLAFTLAGLIAAWRLVPDRLPSSLQPPSGLSSSQISPTKKPLPKVIFDE